MQAANSNQRSGGQILVDHLLLNGVDRAFCVPGESYLAVLDALHDLRGRIALVNARHEAGAANMAEAYGKLTGRPGIALVTRGPGACHAAVGVHVAAQDSTPMILLVGQVARGHRGREAFQEMDYASVFGSVAKWVAEIDSAARIPEFMTRAFHEALSGRPGPVVLSLPEDVLSETAATADARPARPARPAPGPADLDAIRAALATARRPVLLLGGPGWSDAASADIAQFATAHGLPTLCSFRRQDIMGRACPVFAGDLGTSADPALRRRLARADLILAIGARLGDTTTGGYEFPGPEAVPRLIHVHSDPGEPGRVFPADPGITATSATMAAALAACDWELGAAWADWLAELRAAHLDDTDPPAYPGRLDMGAAMVALADWLPEDAIVTLDAGNHTGWAQRFLPWGRPGRQLGSTCGAMGYAVPAAVAAALAEPGRRVMAFVGDGGFQMSGLEIATAVQHGAAPIILLVNNGSYGTIRMHQEREYPGRVIGTDLANPDFVALAAACGAHAARVEDTAAFLPALEAAAASGRAALIELVVDLAQITTRSRLDPAG